MNKRGEKFLKIFSLVFLVVAVLFLFSEIPFIRGVDTTPPSATSIIPINNTQTTNHAVTFSAELDDNDSGLESAYLYVFDSSGNLISTKSTNYNTSSITFSQISAGASHTCGILTNGTAMCWGYNGYGNLGDGTFDYSRNFPVAVSGGYNFLSISAGYDYTCGVLTDGTGLCWGHNTQGELGNGTTEEYWTATPQAVSGNYNWLKITSGFSDTCGILTNGTGLCWGYNEEGQLGNGTLGGTFAVPVPVSGNYNFSQIITRNTHTCGVLTNNTLLCWGDNSAGELGNGTVGAYTARPQPVSGNYNFSQISGGVLITCGVLTNSTLLCWGYNEEGELGNGTLGGYTAKPQPVSGNYNWSQMSSGIYTSPSLDGFHNCGVLTNGTAMCWGDNNFSELGNNDVGNPRYVPTAISGDFNLSSVSAGAFYTCGILTNGTGLCWGSNEVGQLGNNIIYQINKPVPVSGNYNFSKIFEGADCGVLTNGTAMCWGYNYYGVLGDNTTSQRNAPVPVSGNYNFSSISGELSHTCGTLTNGSGLCWGNNYYGELGNGTTGGQSNIPRAVSGNYNFSSISVGWAHVCGILTNGTGLCWGYNSIGELGNGTTINGNIPKPVSGNYNFSSVSAGFYHTCGLLTNSTLLCWGDNSVGELGNGNNGTGTNKSSPIAVSGNYNFSYVSLGFDCTCGILTNGTAMCWGDNGNGNLGDNTLINRNVPTTVSGNYNFSSISTGWSFTCGVLTNGTGLCWGNNGGGELGNGSFGGNLLIPTTVSGNYNFSSISLGWAHTCGTLTNGSGLCWGDDYYGELGDNSSSPKSTLALVYSKIIFSNTLTLIDGVYTWFMNIFDRSGNNYNTGNYTLTVYTGSVPPVEEQSGGSLPPSSSENTIYVPAALNDNFWTQTTIILADNWQPVQEFSLAGESTPITEPEAQTLEQQLINELKTNPNAETQEITVKEITENLSTGERVNVDVKNSSYYVGVANVSADSVIVQVSGGGGGATQSLMKLGDIKKFDLNGDGLTDMKIEIISLEPLTKAGIKIEVVYNGLLNAKEIQQYNQNQKSNKLLMFAFIFIGVLIAITIYFRFRKYK